MSRSLRQRASGLLMHPTSLPNAYPIGDLGPAAHTFVNFLIAAGQHWWQMLPISPVGAGSSPYQSLSSFAANPLLLSPDKLFEAGWLSRSELASMHVGSKDRVDYTEALSLKARCLETAFQRFESEAGSKEKRDFERDVRAKHSWLPDFALFMALRERHASRAWWTWEKDLRKRDPKAISAARLALSREIRFHEFTQWQFSQQWEQLKAFAAEDNIGFIGDLPIFVSADSADVWASPEFFTLQEDGSPATVAGVPPDYFSKTGQLWGNPHYRWDAMKKDGYSWWVNRLKTILGYFDAVRIDHFIGFVRYYEIPAGSATAEGGTYRTGPGAHFFKTVLKKLRAEQAEALIVEDLGNVTADVKTLRDQFGFPGMKVLQFAFGDDAEAPNFQPHNYPPHCVTYTGTHDNNTTVGWFHEEAGKKEAEFASRYLNSHGEEINWDMIRAALASPSNTAIVPMQDVLGLGSEARMNIPGIAKGNWEWRMPQGALTPALAKRLRTLAVTYQRTVSD